jgi:hypothetical protein
VPHARRGEHDDFGDFSTAHSNGTNKVIDTRGTFLLSFSVYIEAHPRLFTLPAPAPSGSLEGPFSLPIAAPIPNPFRIRTSANPLPQLFYNPHLQKLFGSAGNNRLTISESTHINLLESALTRLSGSAGNKQLISPLESALAKIAPVISLESALTKMRGEGEGQHRQF